MLSDHSTGMILLLSCRKKSTSLMCTLLQIQENLKHMSSHIYFSILTMLHMNSSSFGGWVDMQGIGNISLSDYIQVSCQSVMWKGGGCNLPSDIDDQPSKSANSKSRLYTLQMESFRVYITIGTEIMMEIGCQRIKCPLQMVEL